MVSKGIFCRFLPTLIFIYQYGLHIQVISSMIKLVTVLLLCLQIRYWRQHEREAAADRVRTAGLENTARVTGLRPNTLYHIIVLAYNSAGTGPPSPRTTVVTKKPRKTSFLGSGSTGTLAQMRFTNYLTGTWPNFKGDLSWKSACSCFHSNGHFQNDHYKWSVQYFELKLYRHIQGTSETYISYLIKN